MNRTGFDGDSQLVSSISEVSLMVASLTEYHNIHFEKRN